MACETAPAKTKFHPTVDLLDQAWKKSFNGYIIALKARRLLDLTHFGNIGVDVWVRLW